VPINLVDVNVKIVIAGRYDERKKLNSTRRSQFWTENWEGNELSEHIFCILSRTSRHCTLAVYVNYSFYFTTRYLFVRVFAIRILHIISYKEMWVYNVAFYILIENALFHTLLEITSAKFLESALREYFLLINLAII